MGAEIARVEATIQNLERSQIQSKEELKQADDSYLKAVAKEADVGSLSPKEKAIHLLDAILEGLKSFGANADSITKQAMELKDSLLSILKIASDQSQNLKDEFLARKNRLEELLKQLAEKDQNAKYFDNFNSPF